jgi:hypothetical protein
MAKYFAMAGMDIPCNNLGGGTKLYLPGLTALFLPGQHHHLPFHIFATNK